LQAGGHRFEPDILHHGKAEMLDAFLNIEM